MRKQFKALSKQYNITFQYNIIRACIYSNRTYHQQAQMERKKQSRIKSINRLNTRKNPISLKKLRSTSGGQLMVLLHHILP